MSPIDWVVVAAGIAAIAWVNWYFFLAERGSVGRGAVEGAGGGGPRNGGSDDAKHAVHHGH